MILSNLNEIIKTAALSNYLVNDAFIGDVYDINSKENKYGCFVATPRTALRSNYGTINYNYVMYYIDRLTEDEKNLDFVQTDAVSVLKGLIGYLEEKGFIEVEGAYQFTLFRHQFDDWCAGAWVEVNVVVPDDDCDINYFEIGKVVDLRPIRITENGIYKPIGFDGYDVITVDVRTGGVTEEWVKNYTYSKSEVDSEIDIKLTGYATEQWVSNQGYLTEHQSLADYALKSEIPSLTGYATESWVESKGYLTEHQDLSNYATKDEIPSLTGYATESWVESKGYLTEHQSLIGYATEQWVNNQGYLKQHQSLDNYLNKTFTGINTLAGKIQVGDATTNVNNAYLHIRNVGTSTLTGSKVNGACFAVNSDGTTGFFHKSYNDDGSGAKNDAVLRFSSNGIQFAKKPGGNVAEADYKDVAMKEDIPSVWTGTQAEWDLLTDEQKASYTIALVR